MIDADLTGTVAYGLERQLGEFTQGRPWTEGVPVQGALDQHGHIGRLDVAENLNVVGDVADPGEPGDSLLGVGALEAAGHRSGQPDVAAAGPGLDVARHSDIQRER